MITETIRRNLQSSTRWLQPAAHKCIFPASSTVSQQPTALCQAPTGFLLLIAFNFIGSYCNHFESNCQDFLPKFWFADSKTYLHNGIHILFTEAWHIPLQARSRYIDVQNYTTINGDMGVPFQARSRYFSRLAVLKLSWGNSWLTPRKLMNR